MIIKPEPSKSYLRFVLVIYLLTVGLVCYSSFYWIIKLIISMLIFLQARYDVIHKSPCPMIHEIHYYNGQWALIDNNQNTVIYEQASILIHNILFQLISFSSVTNKNKFLILFNDQIPNAHLRFLHHKTTKYSI